MKQSAADSPLRVFGAMLAYYRTHAGMTPEQLGTRVFLSGSQIRKVEAGTRTPTEDLAKACEGIHELGCNGALTELYEILGEKLKRRAYPGWFIVVQVIPLEAGAHEGMRGGAFMIADFDGAATIAYQDTAVSGQIIEDASEADALAHTWDTLRLEALPRAASLSLIEETARQWT
jgi:transcriptional regulator with XRE-family HTH domain